MREGEGGTHVWFAGTGARAFEVAALAIVGE